VKPRAGSLLRGSIALVTMGCALVGCGPPQPTAAGPSSPAAVFRTADCGGVTDADVTKAAGKALFAKVALSDVGCFWQEQTAIGNVGVGMGITTWWYRGSDLDTERSLERKAGRTLTELSLNGNKGFKAYDENACSVYVTKGDDVIAWSLQTLNPAMLPDLCAVTGQLAQLSQDRMN
jgi:Protein of unknown function (DUF3558)